MGLIQCLFLKAEVNPIYKLQPQKWTSGLLLRRFTRVLQGACVVSFCILLHYLHFTAAGNRLNQLQQTNAFKAAVIKVSTFNLESHDCTWKESLLVAKEGLFLIAMIAFLTNQAAIFSKKALDANCAAPNSRRSGRPASERGASSSWEANVFKLIFSSVVGGDRKQNKLKRRVKMH